LLSLSGTLKIEEIAHDQFRHVLARYFSSRNWKVNEDEYGLIARVGATTDLLFRGYAFFCKQVEFDLSQPGFAAYRFKPNWLIVTGAIAFCWLAAAVIIGAQHARQDLLKVLVSIAFLIPAYALFMVAQLKSVVLRDLKAVTSKV